MNWGCLRCKEDILWDTCLLPSSMGRAALREGSRIGLCWCQDGSLRGEPEDSVELVGSWDGS